MTLTISTKDPMRYACEACECEVGGGKDPTHTVVIPEAQGWGHRQLRDEEDPVVFDPECPCDCHWAWKLMWEKLGPLATKKKRTRKPKATAAPETPAAPAKPARKGKTFQELKDAAADEEDDPW